PMQITARLAPREAQFLPEVTLTVPTLPIKRLGIEEALRTRISQGSFAGQITIRSTREGDQIELKGTARSVLLEEFTGQLSEGPIQGQMDITIDEARVRNHALERLRCSGQIRR